MLTVEKVNEQLAGLRAEADIERKKPAKEKDPKKYKRLQREHDKYLKFLPFLLTNPSVEYLEKEAHRLQELISKIRADYPAWKEWQKDGKTEEEYVVEFNKIKNMATHQRHLKNTMFILNG